MTGYQRPSDTAWITASWASHKNRNPPSSEPGTDYGSAHGSPLYAVEDGVVTYVKHTTSDATGRVCEYRLDDGRTTRSLHLSEVWVSAGQRVHRGQQIGRTGASGFGSEWGYGAHVHQTLWAGEAWAGPTIDFEAHVGQPTDLPIEEGFWMALSDSDQADLYAHIKFISDQVQGRIATDRPATGQLAEYLTYGGYPMAADVKRALTGADAADGTKWAHAALLEDPKHYAETHSDASVETASGGRLAWVVGCGLGLIGLVEVLRFIADVLV